MNTFLAHRISALNSVLHPDTDPEYELRRILRWYSQKFGIPLHPVNSVHDIPLDDLLQNYYEAKYEEMEDMEPDEHDQDQRPYLVRERDLLCETDEERKQRLLEEAEDKRIGDKFQKIVEEENEKAGAKAAAIGARLSTKKAKLDQMDMQDLIQQSVRDEARMLALADKIKKTKKKLTMGEDELDIDQLPSAGLPPEISMKFTD